MNEFEEITQMRAQAIRVSMEGGKLSSIVEWICLDSWTNHGDRYDVVTPRGEAALGKRIFKGDFMTGEINV